MLAEPFDTEEQFEGDDLYATLSSAQYQDTDLGSSPIKTRPPSSSDSGIEDFVFATQASIEEEMECPSSASIRLDPQPRCKAGAASFKSPLISSSENSGRSRPGESANAQFSEPAGHIRRTTPPSPSRHPYKQLTSHKSPTRKRSTPKQLEIPIRKPVPQDDPKPVKNTQQAKWTAHLPKDLVIDLTLDEVIGPVMEAGPSRPTSSAEKQYDTKTETATPNVTTIELSVEQRKILDIVIAGQSLFFTGSAGTGKSVLLREIIKQLSKVNVENADGNLVKKRVAVTASTGIAGVNIGGQTLHSWAGVGLATDNVQTCANRVIRQDMEKRIGRVDATTETALERWTKTDVLIVDEMSMIDGRLWDKLEGIARILRKNTLPFGGIQLVLCGDFFQLPPVPDRHDKTSVFAFDAQSWPRCVPHIIKLTQVFRQANQRFVDMLTEARIGKLSGKTIRGFACLQRPVRYEDGIDATELFPTKRQSDNANQSKLSRLAGDTRMFVSIDKEGIKPNGDSFSHQEAVTLLNQHARAPAVLDLRIGAQVMLVVNMPNAGLCNGSVGKVVAFETVMEERQRLSEQIAKEQDKQKVEDPAVDKAMTFPRQASEALLKLLSELGKLGAPPGPAPLPNQIPMSKTYRHDADLAKNKWPVVEFSTGQRKLIVPQDFEVNSQKGVLEAKRIQVPLILAWALSIHKAQGITMPRLKVDLAKTFEKGQAYVALSRATSLETLEVSNFRAASVLAHPRVIEWAECLEEV